jgi:hypothetical protein
MTQSNAPANNSPINTAFDLNQNCKTLDDFLGYAPSFSTIESKRSNKHESIAVKAIPATTPILF